MSKIKNELKNDPLMPLRHSAEHILHLAMQEIYPSLKKVMGPPIEDGFYFDFDLNKKITPEDFPKIEEKMQEIINADLHFKKEEVSAEKAKEIFKDNPYKLDNINEIQKRGEDVTLYSLGDKNSKFYDLDLCAGPHVKSTKEIKAFKLLSVAGAYWKGDEKNKMLQRIYGTAFDSKEALEEYLKKQEDAKNRDHRVLGKELELFTFSDMVGKGLPLFTEKGATIWRELERFVVDEETKDGYKHVKTPSLAKTDLYRKSGHYPYYADTMYPVMKVDEEELILRPMTCPHHFSLYLDKVHSYKELPLRFAEMASQFRYELSGTLTGLIRVRSFCLADAHIFVRKEQAADEIKRVIALIERIASTLGLKKGENYVYRLSLGDRENKKKYYDAPKEWEYAENVLRTVLKEVKAPFYEAKNEAAFYGPKIDIQMYNVAGKEDTAFTVQYDFVMPERFDLKYVNEKGGYERPVVIHRSSIGALERVMGFLIEYYAGAFPVWLAPIQAVVIPIGEKHKEYAHEVALELKESNIRVEVDDRDEMMHAKIRDAQKQKVPYMLVVGDREAENQTVSVRLRTGENKGALQIDEVKAKISNKYLTKALDLW